MSEAKDIIKTNDALLAELRGMIVEARGHVAQVANATLTMLFWRIGQRIHRYILREKRAVYGKQIVAALGRHLTAEFGAEDRMTPDLARTPATKTPRCHQDFASKTGSEEEGNWMILHAYPGRAFAKSNSGDFIPHVGMDRITKILSEWKEKLSRIVDYFELKKDDYKISLGRYIHTGGAETYRHS